MEVADPANSLNWGSTSSMRICRRCSEPLDQKAEVDTCERCEEEERRKQRSDMLDALAFQRYVPSIACALGPMVETTKNNVSSNVPPSTVHSMEAPRQTLNRHEKPFDARKALVVSKHREPKAERNHYPEVAGKWLPVSAVPSSSRSNTHVPPTRPAMSLSQPIHRSLPSQVPMPVYFNAKGELVKSFATPSVPPPRSRLSLPTHDMQPHRAVRLCVQRGCAAILAREETSDICSKCRAVSSRPRHELYPVHPPQLHLQVNDISEPHPTISNTSEEDPDGIADMQLLYPEEEAPPIPPPTYERRPTSVPRVSYLPTPTSPARPHHVPQTTDSSKPMKHSSSNTPAPPRPNLPRVTAAPVVPKAPLTHPIAPAIKPPSLQDRRKCATSDCDNAVPIHSTASRCLSCIKKEWKSKLEGPVIRSLPRPHKRRKTVTWEDIAKVEEVEASLIGVEEDRDESEPVASTSQIAPMPTKLKIRIPALKSLFRPTNSRQASSESSTAPDMAVEVLDNKEEDAVFSSPSSQLQDSPSTSRTSSSCRDTPSTSVSPPPPAKSTHSATSNFIAKDDTRASPSFLFPPHPSTTPRIEVPTDLLTPETNAEEEQYQPISGWDSDLTNLSDLTDLDETETDSDATEDDVDKSSSSDAESSTRPPRPSFTIRIPARSTSVTPQAAVPVIPLAAVPVVPPATERICNIPKCKRVLAPGYRWKCCVQCRLHHREYQRKRQNIQGRHYRLDNQFNGDLLTTRPLTEVTAHDPTQPSKPVFRPPPDLLTPGARLCTIKYCTRIIPAPEEYSWKMCEPCRIRTRKTQRRRRLIKEGKFAEADALKDDGPEPGSGSESEEIPLAAVVGKSGMGSPRRCRRRDCGLLINPKSQDTLCNHCRTQRLERRRTTFGETSDPLPKIPAKRDVPPPKKTIPPYNKYTCWSSLLDLFQRRIASFFEAHMYYNRFKQSQPLKPMQRATFKFEGEWSVVALDFDILAKKTEVHRQTMKLKDEIGRIGGLAFHPTYWVTILRDEEGIAVRFECHLKSPNTTEMRGELEIAILPDHTHTLFPGQRTIVRFCLVG